LEFPKITITDKLPQLVLGQCAIFITQNHHAAVKSAKNRRRFMDTRSIIIRLSGQGAITAITDIKT